MMIEAIRYAHKKRNELLPVKHYNSASHVFDEECYYAYLAYNMAMGKIYSNKLLYYFLLLIRWI